MFHPWEFQFNLSVFTFRPIISTTRGEFSLDFKFRSGHILYLGPDHVQMTKVFWRLKVNWKNFQQKFKNIFQFTLRIVNHVV